MTMLKAIIFDFDGVICESIEAKTAAFRKLFVDYPDRIDEIVKVHMDNGGMSRYLKFEMVYRDILHKKLSSEESQKLGRLFTEYCYDEVVHCPYVKGAYEFLEKYYRQLSLFVVSGTPEDEVIEIVKERGLTKFFKGVYGSPRFKGDLNHLIMKENGLKKEETIFVGDSINDWQGAQKAGIRFIGRVHERYPSPFKALSQENLVKDIDALELLLKRERCLPASR